MSLLTNKNAFCIKESHSIYKTHVFQLMNHQNFLTSHHYNIKQQRTNETSINIKCHHESLYTTKVNAAIITANCTLLHAQFVALDIYQCFLIHDKIVHLIMHKMPRLGLWFFSSTYALFLSKYSFSRCYIHDNGFLTLNTS